MKIYARLLTTTLTPRWKVWLSLKLFAVLTTAMNWLGCWIETERQTEAKDLYPSEGLS